MSSWTKPLTHEQVTMFARACDARDARFDGVFFVGITTTHIYCRPGCPARISHRDRRRFYPSAPAAERDGFRPCLRCRPELAPGLALIDAIPRLARTAARRIASGALNGRSVADLARELDVSERHLRRALEREIGVSPQELARTHRLLLAKQLLSDTNLSVTRIAYASGFQSLRRFNASFRDQYRMAPTAIRKKQRRPGRALTASSDGLPLELRLAYRAPLDWVTLLRCLRSDAISGVEWVTDDHYARTIDIDGHRGVVIVDRPGVPSRSVPAQAGLPRHHLRANISPTLIPVLMPLLARLRQLFDLDAVPVVIDHHLSQAGLESLVLQRPGLRIPGAIEGFEVAFRVIARGSAPDWRLPHDENDLATRLAQALGTPFEMAGQPLHRLSPTAASITEAGITGLERLGMPAERATAMLAVARLVMAGSLCLEPGGDVQVTHGVLTRIPGIDAAMAESILMRALRWPDAFPVTGDVAHMHTTGAAAATHERWRPWRAYGLLHATCQAPLPLASA